MIITVSFSTFLTKAQIQIPDPNFEQALINLGYDNTLDGQISNYVWGVYTLNLSNKNISDLTGIEAFPRLKSLYCDNNQLTFLELSNNDSLQIFSCNDNYIDSLDLSGNLRLSGIHCDDNELNYLNVSGLVYLENLKCKNNSLTSLDFSASTNLKYLDCGFNFLTQVDISQTNQLISLFFNNNLITELDASGQSNLDYISFGNNNNLYCLNLKNGNPTDLSVLYSMNNPNLYCIEVDSVEWANWQWSSSVDPWTTFSEDCDNSCSNSIGLNTIKLKNYEIHPNPVESNEIVHLEGINNVHFSLTSLSGMIVQEGIIENEALQLSEISPGYYLVQIPQFNFSVPLIIK